jgi:hypothetical protein
MILEWKRIVQPQGEEESMESCCIWIIVMENG